LRLFLDGFSDRSRTQAPGTDPHPFDRSCLGNQNPELLEVGIPDLFCLVVRMADAVSHNGPLTANLTHSRHNKLPSENQIGS